MVANFSLAQNRRESSQLGNAVLYDLLVQLRNNSTVFCFDHRDPLDDSVKTATNERNDDHGVPRARAVCMCVSDDGTFSICECLMVEKLAFLCLALIAYERARKVVLRRQHVWSNVQKSNSNSCHKQVIGQI